MANLQRALAEKFAKLEKAIKSATIKAGRGYRLKRGPGGTSLDIQPSQGLASELSTFFRLEAADVMDGEEVDTNKVLVRYSTLGGTAPDDFTPGDVTPFLFTITAAGFVYAHVVIDDETGDITARTIENGTETPESDDTDYYEEIGSYSIDGDTDRTIVSQGRFGPIGVSTCRQWGESPIKYGLTFS